MDLNDADQQVDIYLEHDFRVRWECPQCGQTFTCWDHGEERVWSHMDTCQFSTYLHARIPRVDCPEHGVLQVKIPGAEPRSRFTLLFERLAILVMEQCATVMGTCRLLRLTWDEVWVIMNRTVSRGLQRKPERLLPVIGVMKKR